MLLSILLYLLGSLLLLALGSAVWSRLGGPRFRVKGKHVLVTGGSQGLGLEVARLCVREGARRVTLMARNEARLESAKKSLEGGDALVDTISCDVAEGVAELPGCEVLFSCAGFSTPKFFLDSSTSEWTQQWKVNCLGQVNAVRAVLPAMLRRGSGSVVLTSSTLALTGFVGYSAYASSKWAVRGFAECLRNEVRAYEGAGPGVSVHHFMPPTMDTAGLKRENASKPAVTAAIEDGADTLSPQQAAELLFAGLRKGQFCITADWITELMRMAAQAVSPHNNFFLELLVSPLSSVFSLVNRLVVDYEASKAKKTL